MVNEEDDLHLFGYGSLIFKAPFPYASWQPCFILGYRRVFYQGSTDHRGTLELPGRVVTLEKCEDPYAKCGGVLFVVPAAARAEVLKLLDIREKGGYEQRFVTCFAPDGRAITDRALCYIAGPNNSDYVGSATEENIAAHIARCHGPSGSNAEYAIKLAECLRILGFHDDHVLTVEQHLKRLNNISSSLSLLDSIPLDPAKRC